MSDAWPSQLVTYFYEPPLPGDVPARLPSPFAPGPPAPLARKAAEVLQERLRRERWEALEQPGGGKMLGVLVVAEPGGRVGFLRAFSGMLGGAWNVEGFVPPLFDPVARDAFWPAGEAELAVLGRRHAALLHAAASDPTREAELAEVAHSRAERSRDLWRRMALSYVIPNARGESQPLGALFAPRPPPGGAGDCAAPKLLAYAFRHQLTPLALAEFWWGAPPLDGRRESGAYYPACDNKCGIVLPYMLQGLSADPAPRPVHFIEEPRILHEDPWLLVVDKPVGLPTVPERHSPARDSVLVRLQSRFPTLSGADFLHDLEPEVSGLLVVSRDAATRATLLRQFARREAELRQVSWVEGRVPGESGLIEQPLRGPSHAPPEDCVDRVHGKRAVTAWKVLARGEDRTRVEWVAVTRHPFQVRIHAAHRLGLGAPIVGDERFGREDTRLMLHAAALAFTHPHTGARLDFSAPAPF
ncbi:RluA family pseudouridine synthase [Corallococcus terminator]|uniref:RluA family pseudouridine synthase n=1 Tax=Corallococcus terminator TaxID=2316733 RepID=A0A3A8HY62_9BACT|nr:RluA family pseudouridine synthase [Corallococcus terminator]RKG72464.1 RluA family pseudouridine synthase [Corallococcus terminator]